MSTANEAWLDALIRHQVGLMRLAPSISTKVNSLLNASEKDIVNQIKLRAEKGMSTARLDGLLKTIKAARSKAWKEVKKEWAGKMLDLAKSEPEFLDRTLQTVSPATLDITLPNASTLGSIAKETPFEGRTMSDWANRVEASDMSRIEQSIKIGLSQGQSSQEIAQRIVGSVQMKGMDGVTQITRNNANAITRTAVNAISNAAKQEFYQENAELFSGEMFLATLDSRTTLVCASNDNEQFKIGEGPVPPLHWQCRSLRLAIINGEVIGERPMRNFTKESLEREYAEQGSKGSWTEFKKRRMRELTGTSPASLSYNDWLRGQSPAFQDDILGPSRGKLFRDKGITLDKFVNRAGDKLTLKQLETLDHSYVNMAVPKGMQMPFKASSVVPDEQIAQATPPVATPPVPAPDLAKQQAAVNAAKSQAALELEREAEAAVEAEIKAEQLAMKLEEETQKRIAKAVKEAEQAANAAKLEAEFELTKQKLAIIEQKAAHAKVIEKLNAERVELKAIEKSGLTPEKYANLKLQMKDLDDELAKFQSSIEKVKGTPSENDFKLLIKQVMDEKVILQARLDGTTAKKVDTFKAAAAKPVAPTVEPKAPSDPLKDFKAKYANNDPIEASQEFANVRDGESSVKYTKAAEKHFYNVNGTYDGSIKGTLTDKERRVLNGYGKGEYEHMRAVMAKDAGVDMGEFHVYESDMERARERMSHLISGQEKLTMDNPTNGAPLYRGVKLKPEDLKTWLESEFLDQSAESTISTSINRDVARGFAGIEYNNRNPVILQYNNPRRAAPFLEPIATSDDEMEMLLKGEKMKIVKKEYSWSDRAWTFVLEHY